MIFKFDFSVSCVEQHIMRNNKACSRHEQESIEKVRILSRRVAHLQKKRGSTVVDGVYES